MSQEKSDIFKRMLLLLNAMAIIWGASEFLASFIRQNTLLLAGIIIIVVVVAWALSKLSKPSTVERLNVILLGGIFFLGVISGIWLGVVLSNAQIKPIQVEILEPQDSAVIRDNRFLVSGTVSDPHAIVFVSVRPFATLDYWIQQRATVDNSGNWQVNAYFGEDMKGSGENSEITALATHENFIVTWLTGNILKAGKTDEIPNDTNLSNIVNIKREP